jgi:nucleoside-diphosphate-sugar epimerase
VARVLIVGCGCRGRELAAELTRRGHAVRGTTRDPSRATAIEAAGAEAVVADPDRLATLLPQVAGVSAVCWLLGSATGRPELHGDRLKGFLERLVDTPVRSFVYEAAGSAGAEPLARGAAIVREASAVWRIPVEIVGEDPAAHSRWVTAMMEAITRLLAR